jgi:tRNA pseudouridine55 synthase
VDGVLVVDKPQGLTSHDVVAVARRALKEKRIGHTGTLDPLATGVLPLAVGRATRLVRFLTASDKDYEATIRFGVTTDSYDITGAETSRTGAVPSRDAVERAMASLRGRYHQMPPAFSAKKVAGRRAYDLARRDQAVALSSVPVHVERAEIVEVSGAIARVAVTCSAGFYVRSFAHAVGELVGTGACLEALRRTRSGAFVLNDAVTIEELHAANGASSKLIPLERLLPDFPALTVTSRGRAYVSHGRALSAGDYEAPAPGRRVRDQEDPDASDATDWVRIFDSDGALVAVGRLARADGLLQPAVVLI